MNELLAHHETRLGQTLEVASAGPVTAFAAAAALPWTRRKRRFAELDPMNQLLAVGETAAHLEVLVAPGPAGPRHVGRRASTSTRPRTPSADPGPVIAATPAECRWALVE